MVFWVFGTVHITLINKSPSHSLLGCLLKAEFFHIAILKTS